MKSEYRAAHPSEAATSFTDSTVGNRFTCTAVIGESVEHFGSTTIGFIKKKDAKQYAAKKAVEWLIENRYMPADGSVSFPKQVPTSPTLSNSTSLKNTFAQQVPILCVKLGFSPPTYVLEPREGATAMYNGYAHFAGDPRVYGRVGEFHNVFGKKNAKEVCAEGVLAFLRGVERDRMGLATANTNSTSDAGGEKVLEFLDAVESQTEDSEVEENGKRKRLGDKSVIADTAAASTEKKTKLTSDL